MMFVILSYDVGAKRVARTRKTVKKYLSPVLESVFEGELTPASLEHLKTELAELIDPAQDSIVIYRLGSQQYVTRSSIGIASAFSPDFL